MGCTKIPSWEDSWEKERGVGKGRKEREREKARKSAGFLEPAFDQPLIHFLLLFLPLLLLPRSEIFSLNSSSQRWYNRRRHIPRSPKNIPHRYRRRSNTRNTIILRREISFLRSGIFCLFNFLKFDSNRDLMKLHTHYIARIYIFF